MPPERAARPDAASSVAPVVIHYRDFLRPCLRTSIAPRRRATFRQALLLRELLQRRVVEHQTPLGPIVREAHGDDTPGLDSGDYALAEGLVPDRVAGRERRRIGTRRDAGRAVLRPRRRLEPLP